MNFLHPWALGIGAAAVGLPLVIHWLTRPRPVRMPLSTVRFVMEAVQQRRARYRLRDWIILLLRVAAVALLAWAFARPITDTKPLVPPVASASGTTRIVLLDQSQSTAATANGIAAFDRAKPIAARYLGAGAGVRANLIFAAARPRPVFERVSTNLGALRDELAAATSRPERLDLQAAINRAGEMLAADGQAARRELVIISDFQRANWAAADFSPLPKDTLIQIESVAPAEAPANVSVQRIAAGGRVEQGREVPVEVEVGNFSKAARTVRVELTIGGASYQLSGLCPPGAKTTLVAAVVPKDAGWQTGAARVLGGEDALPADDVRPFVLDVRPTPTYAMVTRESAKPRATSSHFLERALAPAATTDRAGERHVERVIRLSPATDSDKEKLAAADLIVLDHPGKLPPDWIDLLAGMVRRGRGMLYVAAEPIDATNLKLFADAAGSDLKLPVKYLPPPAGQSRRDLFLAETAKDQAPFREFGEDLPAAIGPLRFAGGLNTELDERGLIDDVQATYSDRSACLVITACGAGTVCVLNADLAASNLPASPVFVAMVGELVGRLLGRGSSERAVASGERMDEYLPPGAGGATGLTVGGADGATAPADAGTFSDESNFVLWNWPTAGPPGVYTVKRGKATVFAVASAVPPVEGDLTPIDLSLLKDRLAGGRQVSVQSAADDAGRQDTTWAWILAACCGCLLLELLAVVGFRT